MEMRAGVAGTDGTLVQTAIQSLTERGPRNEEDLELFQERTSRVSLMLRYAGKVALGEKISGKNTAFNISVDNLMTAHCEMYCFSSHKMYVF